MGLITPAEVKIYGDIADAPADTVDTLIEAASDAITDAAGCMIVEATSTVVVLGLEDRILNLPGIPVREVHEVLVDGELLDAGEYRVMPQGIYRPDTWACGRVLPEITVSYFHGLPALPGDVQALCAAMVLAGLNSIELGEWVLENGRISSINIDDYREGYATTGESVEMVTPMMLPARTREWLHTRFSPSAWVVKSL